MILFDEFGAFAAFFVARAFPWLDPRAENKEVEDKRTASKTTPKMTPSIAFTRDVRSGHRAEAIDDWGLPTC
jgi:hypothetical protein